MADANTSKYGLTKPEVGASADTWGGKLNSNFDDIDVLLGAIATGGSSNAYTLTTGLSLSALANGQGFWVKWNHTNAGAATLNVDTLGAVDLKRRDGSTALGSGDATSGAYAYVVYDSAATCFRVVVGIEQEKDATLTALAALSWSSGSPLVQFTAADTVSLTLTPSVTSVTARAASGVAATFVSTGDSQFARVIRLEGDRATPTNNDRVFGSFYLSNGSDTQVEATRFGARITNITNGSEEAEHWFSVLVAGAIVEKLVLSGSALRPTGNDDLALGTAFRGFADLYVASGFTFNMNNGNTVLTHNNSQAVLEATTGALVSPLKVSAETIGTLTVASRNRKVVCSGGVTLDDGVFAANDWLIFDPGTSNRTFTRASGLTMYVNGVDSASATLLANQMGSAVWRSSTVVVLTGGFT